MISYFEALKKASTLSRLDQTLAREGIKNLGARFVDEYPKDEYAPQNFLSIAASPADVAWNEPAPPPLIVTLAFSPWCSSNWNNLQTRLWRAFDARLARTTWRNPSPEEVSSTA